jgi:serine/threonine-protein kinase
MIAAAGAGPELSLVADAVVEAFERDVPEAQAAAGELVPRYWRILKDARYLVPHRYEFSSDSETLWNGSASASIAARDGNVTTHDADVMAQVSRAGSFKGRRVKYSAWIRTRKAHINAWFSTYLWFRVEDSNGVVIAYQDTPGLAVGNTDWTQHVIVIDVPEDASVLHYGALIGGAGTFWIDAANISVVGPDEPLTPPFQPPPGNLNRAIAPSRALPFPMNLDFEETVPVHDHLIWSVREQPTFSGTLLRGELPNRPSGEE